MVAEKILALSFQLWTTIIPAALTLAIPRKEKEEINFLCRTAEVFFPLHSLVVARIVKTYYEPRVILKIAIVAEATKVASALIDALPFYQFSLYDTKLARRGVIIAARTGDVCLLRKLICAIISDYRRQERHWEARPVIPGLEITEHGIPLAGLLTRALFEAVATNHRACVLNILCEIFPQGLVVLRHKCKMPSKVLTRAFGGHAQPVGATVFQFNNAIDAIFGRVRDRMAACGWKDLVAEFDQRFGYVRHCFQWCAMTDADLLQIVCPDSIDKKKKLTRIRYLNGPQIPVEPMDGAAMTELTTHIAELQQHIVPPQQQQQPNPGAAGIQPTRKLDKRRWMEATVEREKKRKK